MIIGNELNLSDYPCGTVLLCLGNWDGSNFYQEGVLYEIRDEEGLALYQKNTPPRSGYEKGYSGYSGIWTIPKTNFELEDYL